MNALWIWIRSRQPLLLTVIVLIPFAASQWFIYDRTHQQAERFGYYLGTCAYFIGVLATASIFLSDRWRFSRENWPLRVSQHLAASFLLTASAMVVETVILCQLHRSWPFVPMLRHCFTYHTQLGLLVYGLLLMASHGYQRHEQARRRELVASQLEAQLREAQIAALRSQLQPHFLFNTLQAATVLIYDDPSGAEEILLSLSELLRTSFQTFQCASIPLGREMALLAHYASIQERRFGDRLCVHFEMEPDCESCAIPTFLLQPLLENAVHHGVGTHKEADTISVRATRRHRRLELQIQNRIGAVDADLGTLMQRGVGLANTIARLQCVYGVDQSLEIRNLSPAGVAVSLSLPSSPLSQGSGGFVYELVR